MLSQLLSYHVDAFTVTTPCTTSTVNQTLHRKYNEYKFCCYMQMHTAHEGQEEAQNRQEGTSSNGSAAVDPSLPSTNDTPSATSSQVVCLCCA